MNMRLYCRHVAADLDLGWVMAKVLGRMSNMDSNMNLRLDTHPQRYNVKIDVDMGGDMDTLESRTLLRWLNIKWKAREVVVDVGGGFFRGMIRAVVVV